MAKYTREDQEFFFDAASKILDRFGLLSDVKGDYIVDVIEFYMDGIVNELDIFIDWKNSHRNKHKEQMERELEKKDPIGLQ